MMFQPNEKVVCVWAYDSFRFGPAWRLRRRVQLVEGRVYTVKAILGPSSTPNREDGVRPGWTVSVYEVEHGDKHSAFDPRRFRRLLKRDISVALAALLRLPETIAQMEQTNGRRDV
jgi:hypothetical protein